MDLGGTASIPLGRYSGTNGWTRFRLVLGIGTSARLLGGAVGLGHDLWIGDRDGEQAEVGPRRAQTSSLRVSGTKTQAGVATAGKPLIPVLGRRLIPVSDVGAVLYIRGEEYLF